jgi:hypothetical protein
MSVPKPTAPQKPSAGGRILTGISGLISFGLLGYLILVVAHQMLVPPLAQRLVIVQDIPLPSGLGSGGSHPLAPGVQLQFDGFDFQAYDVATHRLFIAHTGPNPDDMHLNHIPFDARYDGNMVVFDTLQDRVIGV